MSKRFTGVFVALASVGALLAACSSGGDPETPEQPGLEGAAQVSVRGLSAHEIRSLVVTAQPANIRRELVYSPDTGTFTGTLVLPTGTQMLIANGYAFVRGDGGTLDGGFPVDGGPQDLDGGFPVDGGPQDPPPPDGDGGVPFDGGVVTDGGGTTGLTLVATGSATVNIVANTTTGVSMRIYDLTPPDPQPDIAPLIRSVTVSSTNATVNQAITLSVDAVDLDNDPLSYQWTSSCAGNFAQPNAATTLWAGSAPDACTLTVTVSARGQRVSESVTVVVFADGSDAGTGGVQVDGEYVPRPEVRSLVIFNNTNLPYNPLYRSEPRANLPNVRPGQTYYVEASVDFGGRPTGAPRTMNLDITCGSLVRNFESCPSPSFCYVNFLWTTPDAGAACRVTGTATHDTLSDSFSAGVLVR